MKTMPLKPKNKIGKRRWNLWVKDNHCYYCEKELKWTETTLEHLNSRVLRKTRPQVQGETTVLSCEPCNQATAKAEMLSMPRSYWWRRSGSFPKWNKNGLTFRERVCIVFYGWILGMNKNGAR